MSVEEIAAAIFIRMAAQRESKTGTFVNAVAKVREQLAQAAFEYAETFVQMRDGRRPPAKVDPLRIL